MQARKAHSLISQIYDMDLTRYRGKSMTLACCPAASDAAEAFYRVVDAAYDKRSVAVTSNIHPAGFDTIMWVQMKSGETRRPD